MLLAIIQEFGKSVDWLLTGSRAFLKGHFPSPRPKSESGTDEGKEGSDEQFSWKAGPDPILEPLVSKGKAWAWRASKCSRQ